MAFYSHYSIKHQHPCDPPTISGVRSRVTHRVAAPESTNAVRVFFVNMSEWLFRCDFTWQSHIHDFYEIIVLIDGTYACVLNGKRRELRKGQLLLINPGDAHQDICTAGCEYIGFDFRIQNLITGEPVSVFKNSADTDSGRLQDWDLSEIFCLRERLRGVSKEQSPEAMHLQDAYFSQFVWEVVARVPESVKHPSFLNESEKNIFRMRLLDLFDQNITVPVSLEGLAEGMNMSRRSLTAKCDRYFSRPPVDLFQEYRISKAAFLVLRTPMSIKEISYEMGFKNPFHFSRLFRKYLHVSPTEFRSNFRAKSG